MNRISRTLLSFRSSRARIPLSWAHLQQFLAIAVLLALTMVPIAVSIMSKGLSIGKIMLWMGLTIVAGSALVLFVAFTLRRPVSRPGSFLADKSLVGHSNLLFSVFTLFAFVLSCASFLYLSDITAASREQLSAKQNAVAVMKAGEVETWLAERDIDVQSAARVLRRVLLDGSGFTAEKRAAIELVLAEILATDARQTSVSLFVPGQPRIEAGNDEGVDEELAVEVKRLATAAPRPVIRDIGARQPGQPLRIAFLMPIPAVGASSTGPAILALVVDPELGLLPSLANLSPEGLAAHLYLVRRDGDSIRYLMPRDGAGQAGGSQETMSQTRLATVQAILRGDGAREAVDGAGRPVLSASRQVAGTSWTVLLTTDLDEALAPLHQRLSWLLVLVALAMVVGGLMLLALWHVQRGSLLALDTRHVQKQSAIALHFDKLVQQARDVVLLADPDGHIVEVNDAAAAAYGYSPDEFRKLKVRDIMALETTGMFDALWKVSGSRQGAFFQAVHRRKDGSTFPVEISASGIEVDGRFYRQAFIRDVSDRQQLEAEVQRLVRVQRALQAAHASLLRGQDEDDIYRRVCRTFVETAGYRAAAVALANHDEARTIRYASVAGDDDGYLTRAGIDWSDGPNGRGPTGMAIRSGRPQVEQDFAANPTIAPWREEALMRSARSGIGLPLKDGERTVGALVIYAEQPHAFKPGEVEILGDFARDLSWRITQLRHGQGTPDAATPTAAAAS